MNNTSEVKLSNVVCDNTNQNIKTNEIKKIKMCFLGSSGVGKTCLITRLNENIYDPETITTLGILFVKKNITVNDKKIILEIWDTAGQEKYESIVPMYYRSAAIIVVVFDMGINKTYIRGKKWIDEIKATSYYDSNQIIVLLGNKSDKYEQVHVDTNQYVQYAKNKSILFFECSAKTGENVEIAILQGIKNYLEKTSTEQQDNIIVIPPNINNTKKSLCCHI